MGFAKYIFHISIRYFFAYRVLYISVGHVTSASGHFEIGVNNIAFGHFEELLPQFKGVAKVGEVVNFEAGMDIIDILYENRRHRCSTPILALLLLLHIITVPKQMLEFSVLPWVEFVTRCDQEDVLDIVTDILKHVFDACR
ncbi:hypothetical protein C1H46_024847 [Malus baccata]|uniref:Uncharacterized protein n=1 Tax=Malus baccata TaxID=106549 RepID=A0A540LSW6_MALBA|nr:hypothetical protein C1H46_024847 [Malus baccata]